MATIKNYKITRNWGVRTGCEGDVVFTNEVKVGEPYDLVQFSINELDKEYYWSVSIGVNRGVNEIIIFEICKKYAEQITDKEIRDFRWFLEQGEKWGWD